MKTKKRILPYLLAIFMIMLTACNSQTSSEGVKTRDLILATTTSTQDSGLLDVLLPMFEEMNDVNVKTIAVGSGQALDMGAKGEADVLLVHAPEAEQKLVDSGDATNRKRVMYNDFILVGPSLDPIGIKGNDISKAFLSLYDQESVFVSRGDDSGTHKKELQLWTALNLTPVQNSSYLETGQGMGNTLQIASEKQGYVLTDRATFLAQKKNLSELEIIVESDNALLNIYHVMQVNPEKHTKVNSKDAKAFVDFMVGNEAQEAIEEFGKSVYGQSLFTPYTE